MASTARKKGQDTTGRKKQASRVSVRAKAQNAHSTATKPPLRNKEYGPVETAQDRTLTRREREMVRQTIHDLISRTRVSSTICPSQIPRHLHAQHPADFPDWRSMMAAVRDVAWEEVRTGRIEVTQGGDVRSWEQRHELNGPIRLRRGDKWTDPQEPEHT